MSVRRAGWARVVCLAVGVIGLSTAGGLRAAPVSCQADIEARLRSEDTYDQYIDKIFMVTITSSEACAKVYFDLTTTEQLFNGEIITSTERTWRKVTAEPSKASVVKHRIARDSSLADWQVKFVRCVVCGTEGQ